MNTPEAIPLLVGEMVDFTVTEPVARTSCDWAASHMLRAAFGLSMRPSVPRHLAGLSGRFSSQLSQGDWMR